MNVFLESPWPAIFFGIVLEAILGVALLRTGRGRAASRLRPGRLRPLRVRTVGRRAIRLRLRGLARRHATRRLPLTRSRARSGTAN